jgi:hypothetical protein
VQGDVSAPRRYLVITDGTATEPGKAAQIQGP